MASHLPNPLRTQLWNHWRGNWNMLPFRKVRLRQHWHLLLAMFNMAFRGFVSPLSLLYCDQSTASSHSTLCCMHATTVCSKKEESIDHYLLFCWSRLTLVHYIHKPRGNCFLKAHKRRQARGDVNGQWTGLDTEQKDRQNRLFCLWRYVQYIALQIFHVLYYSSQTHSHTNWWW